MATHAVQRRSHQCGLMLICCRLKSSRIPGPAADSESMDEEAHAGLLADVRAELRGKGAKRKAHLISEAYPESEYNLQPAGGMMLAAVAALTSVGGCLNGCCNTRGRLCCM